MPGHPQEMNFNFKRIVNNHHCHSHGGFKKKRSLLKCPWNPFYFLAFQKFFIANDKITTYPTFQETAWCNTNKNAETGVKLTMQKIHGYIPYLIVNKQCQRKSYACAATCNATGSGTSGRETHPPSRWRANVSTHRDPPCTAAPECTSRPIQDPGDVMGWDVIEWDGDWRHWIWQLKFTNQFIWLKNLAFL